MISSYVLSSTLVPVLSAWVMRQGEKEESEGGLRGLYASMIRRMIPMRWVIVGVYLLGTGLALYLLAPRLATEIFPTVDAGMLQLRMRAPTGTRIERTEVMELKALDVIRQEIGPENVQITAAFIGVQPPSYPVNTIYLFTSGPQEAVMQVALRPSATLRGEELKERLRHKLAEALPGVTFSFEAGDIISQVMSFGSPTPIEVAMQGPNIAASRGFAEKVRKELEKVSSLRDLQYGQPLDYPTVQIDVDRERAGQFGLSMASVAKSLTAATSSSRFVDPNFWRDPVSGNGFQIQVEIPQSKMQSLADLQNLPVMTDGQSRPLLADVADVKYGTIVGEVDRYNMQRVVSLTANIHGKILSEAAEELRAAIQRAGAPPKGVTVVVRGQIPPLTETIGGLRIGLLLSVAVIFLLLAANFQSIGLALAVLLTVPAVLCGVILMLLVTGTTLNVQSFMGAIMAIGVAVANAILLVTFAELSRHEGKTPFEAAVDGARGRLRAILMTATAMIAGMIPLALGIGQGAEQTAPLGRAVIGGLLGATLATLIVLPSAYAIFQRRSRAESPSLDPDDPASKYYEPA
jgi:multidrug efflux pump subunit AcrB